MSRAPAGIEDGSMDAIADYTGNLLNHVEALYRPGERELAVELAEVLGCTVTDTGFPSLAGTTFLAVHPNKRDLNVEHNVFYISEMNPEQVAIEAILSQHARENPALREQLDIYTDRARGMPFGIPHFAMRYRSPAEIDAIEQRLAAHPRLKDRCHLRVYRPGEEGAQMPIIQGFIHQDVIVSGSMLYGQLIELQSTVEGELQR
jgi:hypothetical protein